MLHPPGLCNGAHLMAQSFGLYGRHLFSLKTVLLSTAPKTAEFKGLEKAENQKIQIFFEIQMLE